MKKSEIVKRLREMEELDYSAIDYKLFSRSLRTSLNELESATNAADTQKAADLNAQKAKLDQQIAGLEKKKADLQKQIDALEKK